MMWREQRNTQEQFRQKSSKRQMKSQSYGISSPYFLSDFQHFLQRLNQRFDQKSYDSYQWTLVLVYDTMQQASQYSSTMLEYIQKTFPFVQVLFTIYKESDWEADTVLVTLFLNQNLMLEQEFFLDNYAIEEIIRIVIPYFSLREDNIDDNQTFRFMTSLSPEISPETSRSSNTIITSLMTNKSQEFKREELGMLKLLAQNEDVDLDNIVNSIASQDDEVFNLFYQYIITQVLKPFLKERFLQFLSKNFSPTEIEIIIKLSTNKLSPIYAAIFNFSTMYQLQELLEIFQENLQEQAHQTKDYSFPPQMDLQQNGNNHNPYSSLLRHNGDKRKSTFKFKIQMGGDFQEPTHETPIYKRKKSDEENNFQLQREQLFLDKFHSKIINYFELDHDNLLLTVIEQKDFLEEEEKNKVIEYYEQGNQRLREILDKFNKTRDIITIKQDVMDLVLLGNSKRFEEISSPANTEFFEPKIQKLKNFRFLINYYYEIDKVFTFKQIKTLYYLYVTEDISVLAAYEVYCENKDQDEFIQTLSLVYKIYSLGNYIELDFDEIEQFDELIDQQLNILFTYRRFFTIDQRSSLEKNLRAGDNTLLKLFKDFMRIKNQEHFIEQTKQFADKRGDEIKRIELILVERRQKRDEQKNENKELIEKLHSQFMKNKVRHVELLLDAVDKDSLLLKSSLEVYKYTLDKQDLVENLVLIYNQIYKANVKTMLKSLTIELQLSKPDLTNLLKKIDQEDPILKGAFELYYITKDEVELKDTIQRMLKLNQH